MGNIEDKIKEIQPKRATLRSLDPNSANILIHSSYIESAFNEFIDYIDIAKFIIVNYTSSDRNSIAALNKKYNCNIYPVDSILELTDQTVCLYGSGFTSIDFPQYLDIENINYAIYEPTIAQLSRWWKRKPYPEFIDKRLDDIENIYNSLADDISKNVFLSCVRTLQSGNPVYLPLSGYPHYFHPSLPIMPGDIVFEGGCATGNITVKFANAVGSNGKVIGFEPLLSFYDRLKPLEAKYNNIIIENFGLWSGNKRLYFNAKGQQSNFSEEANSTGESAACVSIDSYINSADLVCDAIKLDIEGAEFECLKGAYQAISAYHPRMMISLYHHPFHYFDIPIWILKNFPGYKLYMGHHSIWYNETCLYAVYDSE